MENVTNIQKLFAMEVLYRHNVHMLHWNVVGSDFDSAHATLDGFVETMSTHIDQLAEMIKVLGQVPLTLPECINVLTDDSEQYSFVNKNNIPTSSCWAEVNVMFTGLYDKIKEVKEDSAMPADIVSELESMMYYYALEGKYKGRSRVFTQ